jgi:ATP-dependent DNA ligase
MLILNSKKIFDSNNIVAPRVWSLDEKITNILTHCVIDNGGEGVILRKEKSTYIPGRSTSLVKLKV